MNFENFGYFAFQKQVRQIEQDKRFERSPLGGWLFGYLLGQSNIHLYEAPLPPRFFPWVQPNAGLSHSEFVHLGSGKGA